MADPGDPDRSDDAVERQAHIGQSRGQRAQAILDDPLVVEAFEVLDAQYKQMLLEVPLANPQNLVNVRILIGMVEKFRVHFSEAISTGRIATKTLVDIEERKAWWRLKRA